MYRFLSILVICFLLGCRRRQGVSEFPVSTHSFKALQVVIQPALPPKFLPFNSPRLQARAIVFLCNLVSLEASAIVKTVSQASWFSSFKVFSSTAHPAAETPTRQGTFIVAFSPLSIPLALLHMPCTSLAGLMKRSKPLRAQSSKRKQQQKKRRAVLQSLLRDRGEICEAETTVCTVLPVDAHEVLRRSQGGDPTDPSNIILVCRECHEWIHSHPAKAYELGLLKRSWED